ncbi:MAG: hypothetical protein AAF610_14390 [Pseudomonadota bacterium]
MPTVWKNKHVITALLIAPVLALVAYFAVDAAVSEPAGPARPGSDYPLAVGSNCRYDSGVCELKNGDVILRLRAHREGGWQLESELALDGVLLAEGEAGTPAAMVSGDETGLRWVLSPAARTLPQNLRLVVSIAGSRYFAEVPTTFAGRP